MALQLFCLLAVLAPHDVRAQPCVEEQRVCIEACNQPKSSGNTMERNERRNACMDVCERKDQQCKAAANHRHVFAKDCLKVEGVKGGARNLKNDCEAVVLLKVKLMAGGRPYGANCTPYSMPKGHRLSLGMLHPERACEHPSSGQPTNAGGCSCDPGTKEIALPSVQ